MAENKVRSENLAMNTRESVKTGARSLQQADESKYFV